MTVWLVGERNPYHSEPRFALYPLPPNAAGGRLARALGLSAAEYLRRFPERRNLLAKEATRWCAPVARTAARRVLREVPAGAGLVLCGVRVAAAFGLPGAPLAEHRLALVEQGPLVAPRTALVIPHPSGLSRAWNDETMAPRVKAAVEELEARCATS